jgi:outer membrane protein, heavy metal efflux system
MRTVTVAASTNIIAAAACALLALPGGRAQDVAPAGESPRHSTPQLLPNHAPRPLATAASLVSQPTNPLQTAHAAAAHPSAAYPASTGSRDEPSRRAFLDAAATSQRNNNNNNNNNATREDSQPQSSEARDAWLQLPEQLLPQPPSSLLPDTALPDTALPDTALPDTALPDTAQADLPQAGLPYLQRVDLERWMLDTHPRLAALAAQMQAAQGRQVQAGLYSNPVLAYDAGSLGADGTPGSQGFFVDQEIITGGKRQLGQASVRHAVAALRWEFAAEQRNLLLELRQRYARLQLQQAQLELDEQLLLSAVQLKQITQKLLDDDSDEVSDADLLSADILLQRRQLAWQARQRRHIALWRELAAFLGTSELHPQPLRERLGDAQWPSADSSVVASDWIEAHPRMQAAAAEVQRAQASLARQQAENIPNFEVRTGAQYDYTAYETQANVRLSVPWRVYNRNQGLILEAQAEIRRATAERERVRRELEQQWADSRDSYQRAALNAHTYAVTILPAAQQAYEKYLERYREEKTSYSRAESAQLDLADRMAEYLEHLHQLRRAEAELAALQQTS